MSNKVYDFLKNLSLVVLPAIGTFYFSLSQIWGLPYGEEIVGTLSALAVLIGAIVKISHANYHNPDNEIDGLNELFELSQKEGYIGEDYSDLLEAEEEEVVNE